MRSSSPRTKQEPAGGVEPLPEIKPYESFAYDGADAALAVPAGRPGGPAAPAPCGPTRKRNREFLEQFSLDTLTMVGTLSSAASAYGLVKTKDGLVHRVLPGNYLGQNEGRIVADRSRRRSVLPKSFRTDSAGTWSEPPRWR